MTIRDQAEGVYRSARRRSASLIEAPLNRWRYGALAKYLTLARRIPGWTTTREAAALMKAVHTLRENAVIVEVGSFLGKSTVALAGACKLKGDGHVHCVDPFDASGDAFSVPYYRDIARQSGRSLRERFEQNIRSARLSERVSVHQGRAEAIGAQWTCPVDMLFLDGDQSPAGAKSAFDSFARFLKQGALVALHNSSPRDYHHDHDGHRRLAVELADAPGCAFAECIDSITFVTLTP
jgi:predicted O-methyltransferase YrrM